MVQDSWDSEQLLFEHCTSLNSTAMALLHFTVLQKNCTVSILGQDEGYGQIRPFT